MIRLIILITLSVTAITAVLASTIFKEKIKSMFYIDHMESDDRIKRMNIDQITAKLNIKKGDSIADIGAGSGLFSRKFRSNIPARYPQINMPAVTTMLAPIIARFSG